MQPEPRIGGFYCFIKTFELRGCCGKVLSTTGAGSQCCDAAGTSVAALAAGSGSGGGDAQAERLAQANRDAARMAGLMVSSPGSQG